jgi:hypothetical protein
MTPARSFTGRCASATRTAAGGLLLTLALGSAPARSQEAVPPDPPPVPPAAEAAHQDLRDADARREALDEAIFTDISPLTVPEVGIALPADQRE